MEFFSVIKDIVIFFVVTFVFCTVVFPIIIVCSIWWTIVTIGAKIFQKQKFATFIKSFERIQVFMEEKINTELGLVITIPITLQGITDEKKFKESFEVSILQNQGATYNKFHQYPLSWMGYLFYAWEENFDINRHIQKLDETLTEDSIDSFLSKRSRLKFPPRSSMWEILLVHNYNNEDKTLLIIRFHHYVSDGMSILKLLEKLQHPTTNMTEKKKIIPNSKRDYSLFQKIMNIFTCILTLPNKFYGISLKFDNIAVGGEDSGIELFTKTKAFNLENLNTVKTAVGVSLSVLVYHALSATLRNFLLKNYGTIDLPNNLSLLYMLPMDDHPDNNLTNHYGTGHIRLPLYPEDNLAKCAEQHKQCISKTQGPDAVQLLFKLMNVIPNFLFKPLLVPKADKHVGIVVSNILGPSQSVSIFDNAVLDMNFFVGALKNPWIYVSILSYNGNVRVGFGGLSRVFLDLENLLSFRNDFEKILDGIINSYVLRCDKSNKIRRISVFQ